MLPYLVLIFSCQLIGEIISFVGKLPIPGPVIGMAILFLGLMIRGKPELPKGLNQAGDGLLANLALLFVPAGVGLMSYLDLLAKSWVAITAAILGATLLTVAVTGITMQTLLKRKEKSEES